MVSYISFIQGAIIFVLVAIIFSYLENLYIYFFGSENSNENASDPNSLITFSVVSIGVGILIINHYLFVLPEEQKNGKSGQFLNVDKKETGDAYSFDKVSTDGFGLI